MRRQKRRLHRLMALLGLVVLSGCPSGPDADEPGFTIPYILHVRATDVGYRTTVTGADLEAGWQIAYPGVTCFRANHKVKLTNFMANADASLLTLNVSSRVAGDVALLWLRVRVGRGAALATPPRVVNADGDNIFVFGPLPAGGSRPLTLRFNVIDPRGFNVALDFMEVFPRMAYSTNRTDPLNPFLMDIYSLNPNGSDLFPVTRNSTDYNGDPQWSPGAEWIALERRVQVACGGTDLSRPQIYEIHPDGSNLRQVSQNVTLASNPTYNPNGNLLAYDCRPGCHAANPDINICLYDRAADTQQILFPGAPYYGKVVSQPRWSYDGAAMVVNAKDPVTQGVQWLYAPMDPITGDSLASPVAILRGNFTQVFPDTYTYRVFVQDFVWAPDNQHAVIDCTYYQKKTTTFVVIFEGLAIIDVAAILQSPTFPVVPEIIEVADSNHLEGVPHFPRFDAAGRQLWFDSYMNMFQIDIQYVELNNYAPATGVRESFISDGLINRMPAFFRKPIPAEFPL